MTSQQNGSKLPDAPKYDGKPSGFRAFEDQLKVIFLAHPQHFRTDAGVSNEKKILYALQGLYEGTAAGYRNSFLNRKYDHATDSYNFGTWQAFIDGLRTQFQSRTEKVQALQQLRKMKINMANTDILEFNQCFDYLLQEAGIEDDGHQAQLYEDAIPENLYDRIMLCPQQPATYAEWKTIMADLITSYQKMRMKRSRNYRFAPTSFFSNSNTNGQQRLPPGVPMDIDELRREYYDTEDEEKSNEKGEEEAVEEDEGGITEVETEDENDQPLGENFENCAILTQKQKQRVSEGRCIVCGSKNHWARQCPKRRNRNKNYHLRAKLTQAKKPSSSYPAPMQINAEERKKEHTALLNRLATVLLKEHEQDF